MIINNNIPALNTFRQMGINQNNMQASMEKLSSGLRINRAGDDAAGLAISEKMRAQIRGLDQASRNSQDGISLIQTAEGALDESHSILQRMRELAVQASNDTNVEVDRAELQKEVEQLTQELTRIAETTEFNTQNLLGGEFSGTFHIGANAGQDISLTIGDMGAIALGVSEELEIEAVVLADEVMVAGEAFEGNVLQDSNGNVYAVEVVADSGEFFHLTDVIFDDSSADVNDHAHIAKENAVAIAPTVEATDPDDNVYVAGIHISTQESASAAITTINDAIETVSSQRSELGAVQNRLEHTISNLDNSAENLQAAESRIRDVDMAKEMMEMTRANILSQASQAMLAQANQVPQSVLQLLG